MTCICEPQLTNFHPIKIEHTEVCDRNNYVIIKENDEWQTQNYQCSGSGYSHKAHGKCRGYSTDRT